MSIVESFRTCGHPKAVTFNFAWSVRDFCHRILEMAEVNQPLGIRGGLSNPRVRAQASRKGVCRELPERLGLRNGGHFLEFWQKYLSGSRGRFFATFFAPDWAKKVEAYSNTNEKKFLD